jgi:peptidoglycan/xylan/chitin deacetylase (PgdA/CDA1 family)
MIRDSFERVARMPMRRLASGGAILCFHSITTPDAPSEGTAHVSLTAFQSTINLARRLGELVPLSELVRRHEQGRSTAGLVAVTFDDAYAALAEIKEFVSREGIPISVFVVTQAAAAGATYWWDRIDDLFPRIAGERWRAFEEACGLPEEYRRRQPAALGPLRPLRQWVLATYAGRWPSHLEPALLALEREAGLRTRHRSMTFAEIAELAAVPSVEIGVHTVSHPVLPLLPDPDLTREIAAGYAELRSRLATVLPILAVPFGLYDERTLRVARASGLSACLSVTGANLDGDAHRYVLPRYCVTRHDTPARLALCLVGVPDRVRRWRGVALAPYPELPSATS